MSAAASTLAPAPSLESSATLRELALADARRYARHPLFLVGFSMSLVLTWWAVTLRDPNPVAPTLIPAFLVGAFGFVVAHRLTTSLRRSEELVGSLPSSRRRRSVALCLACLVPFSAGVLCTVEAVVLTLPYPPVPIPADSPMVWYGHASWSVVTAILLALGPVATLGGPLLGVLVGTWAPFRGSALLGVVTLVLGSAVPSEADSPWRALPPWAPVVDENVLDGRIVSSTFVPHLAPVWYLVYVVLLCALAVVAILLHEREGRRPLLSAGAGLLLAACGAFAMTVR
jgi:hypothetical protein